MTSPESFTAALYSDDGVFQSSTQIQVADLETENVQYFQNKFRHLSGDLELPLEDKLPGEFDFIEYRVGSDLSGAFVMYYLHDEVIFASLLLSGLDEAAETELMQVFKFLLLDTGEEDEPTEEEIEEVLSSNEFEFGSITERPAVFQIELSNEEEAQQVAHIAKMDRHLAAAFFGLDRTGSA